MFCTPLRLIAVIAAIAGAGSTCSWAADRLVITVPRRSELTLVQRLNREGVTAVKRQQFDKASALFYKAYLYDPADPFTLNNLGYISELQGELDRAHKFYDLAAEQGSDAIIDRSSASQLEGKPMTYAFQSLREGPMQVNRMNVDAMELLSKDRGPEAIALLQKALSADPQNPFTLNNLGVADETVEDYDDALKEYDAAAGSHSTELVVVTADRAWRGKPVSAMASVSARKLESRMKAMASDQAHAVMFAYRGVSATNENDWGAAQEDFLHAYLLDPASAFSLNNRGYVAEMDGDLETAQFYYDKARKAWNSNDRVGMATVRADEGKKLTSVATDSSQQVEGELNKYSQMRLRLTGPIELVPRDSIPNGDSDKGAPLKPGPSDGPLAPAPDVPRPH